MYLGCVMHFQTKSTEWHHVSSLNSHPNFPRLFKNPLFQLLMIGNVIEIIAMIAKLSKSMSIDGIAKYTKLSLMPAGWWCPQIISFNQRQKQVTTLCDQIGDNKANWTLEVRHQHCINALSIPRSVYLSRSRFQVSFYPAACLSISIYFSTYLSTTHCQDEVRTQSLCKAPQPHELGRPTHLSI